MSFNYITKGQSQWKNNRDFNPQTRYMSILDFQQRILDIATEELSRNRDVAICFCRIVKSNLVEFIQTRLSEVCYIKEHEELTTYILAIFERMSRILNETPYQDCKRNDTTSTSKFLFEKIQVSHWNYINTGENSDIIMEEMESLLELRASSSQYVLLCNTVNTEEYEELEKELSHVEFVLIVPDNILKLDNMNPKIELSVKPPYRIEIDIQPLLDGVRNKEVLIRTPYSDYYNTFLKFHSYICKDPSVETIFMTLYRTAKDSVIVRNLIEAASIYNKNVYVYVELTARGDEEHNLQVVKELLSGDVHVKVGYLGYKVHAKMCIAIKEDLSFIGHIGTGNYNEKTAECYTDFQLFTTNQKLCSNLSKIVMGIFEDKLPLSLKYRDISDFSHAPINLRDHFIQEIDWVSNGFYALEGKKKRILIKCNHLYDKSIIYKLYRAAEAGVEVKIICRTCCGIIPRENLEVRSKLGYYLEHDRFYIFGDDKYYISSSDLMTRNLSKRVELMIPITNMHNQTMMEQLFFKIWDSEYIHRLSEGNEWELINKRN